MSTPFQIRLEASTTGSNTSTNSSTNTSTPPDQPDPSCHYPCQASDTLLRAGLRQGLGLAYECNVGACGSCKFDLIAGEVDDLWPDAPGLRPKERERGKRLACQCVPRSDCTIRLRSGNEYIPQIRPMQHTARLISKTMLTSDIAMFTLHTTLPAHFLPGQYALISHAELGQLRAYSMANLPNQQGLWQFGIRRVHGGKMSNALFDEVPLQDELTLDGPYGLAYLRQDNSRPIVCIGGGSGLAPLLAILRGIGANHTRHPTPTLLYGGRGPSDIPDVPAMLASEGITLHFHPVVSMPELAITGGWSGAVGFVHDSIAQQLTLALTDYEYYLAGPPPMIEATVRFLQLHGKVAPTHIHFDRFF